MLYIDEYLEYDGNAKSGPEGIIWASRLITHFRQYWKPLIGQTDAEKGMNIILSRDNMDDVMKMFKDPKKMAMEFLPIAIMEKVRNILIGERVKAGISVNMNALDPAAESERNADKTMLTNRREMEDLVTFLHQSIGLPEYKLANEEKISGKKPYKGNVELFDKLGLDEQTGYQVEYFFTVWHRLFHEMDAQQIVNYFMEYNEVKDNIPKWVNDIMAKKVIAMQAYVNQISGAIENKYLAPEKVNCIPGKRDDGKDAVCIGYVDQVTVSEVIKRLGNEFEFDRDMEALINAVNWANKKEFTGIWDGSNLLYGSKGTEHHHLCGINEFMNFKVEFGYIEWKSWNAKVYKAGIDYHGNKRRYEKSLRGVAESEEDGGYARETFYQEYTYKSFFLSYSTYEQRLFRYGKLYHQVIEGAEDEYSNYSIFFKKEPGPTIAKVSEPWIKLAQESFVKMRWMVRKAKPKGRGYNYDSLLKIGKNMIKSGDARQNVTGVIKLFEEGINELYVPATDQNGNTIGGGSNPHYEVANGLDATALTFKQIIDWCVSNIKDDIAVNNVRESAEIKPNEGLRLHMQSLQAAQNATNYIGEMIDAVLRNAARHTLLTVQDIIRYKDTIPYKFLQTVIGSSAIERLKQLEGVAHHRYGIFINSFADYNHREKIRQDTEQAWLNKEISYEVKLLIDNIDDWRKAAYILSFEKVKADKLEQQKVQQHHENEIALEQQRNANKMAEIDREGQWKLRDRQEHVRGIIEAARIAAESRERIKADQIENEPEKQGVKTEGKIREIQAKHSADMQQPIT